MALFTHDSARIAAGILHVPARRHAVGRRTAAGCRVALVLLGCVAIVIWMGSIQSSHAAAAELTPAAIVDMFFKTLERQGRNPRVIQSGNISYEEFSKDNTSAEVRQAIKLESDRKLVLELETLANEAGSDLERESWKQEIQRIRKEGAVKGAQAEVPPVLVGRDVFVGNNPRKRSRGEAALKVPSSNGWWPSRFNSVSTMGSSVRSSTASQRIGAPRSPPTLLLCRRLSTVEGRAARWPWR